ncbi:hypothetical protein C9374_000293 [Naegleria lovaniensis]|uniref:RRM domain-containing protein n=1 Tax=Naegleria lovaniensis TaxID=51637 RepID=A0AA88KP91_NAELO|nr:uncharacterized protein C9374_000293 [Naegleria lovaniensis]KAG2388854.1 hypothetical protein C9374_000293 [Naegleria lovaniensis]
MPRRKTIDDDMDETYEDENDSQSSDNFSDLVDEEEETSSAPSKSSSVTNNRTSEPITTSSTTTTTTGQKKRGRKPKNEPKPKKAPTGRPRGRPRKNPIVVTTPTPTKPISPMEDTLLDGGLLSLGQAAVLALNDADLDPGSIKADEELLHNLTTPVSPATPLYPLKKRFLATMSQESDKAAETTTTTTTKPPTPPAVVEPAQPVKRRPGRPRKADKLQQQQQQQQQTTQDKKETAKDDSVKMTSRQQILYLKKLEEKKEGDTDIKEEVEEEEEKEEEPPVSLDFDSDESVEVKKPKKTSKRKLVKKKSSPWTKVEKLTVKYKGRTLGSFDVSLLGSDSSFELDVGSTVEVNQKIALDKVEDIESSSFYILSFSSRSKSEEDKLEEMYNVLERENCVGSISFDDRILLFIPKKSRFLKPLGLTEVQDDPSKFIGALMMKDDSSPERTSKKNKKTSSSSTPILTTPKSPTSNDEDIKKKQLSLLSIPKIPKNKATLSTPTGETPVQMENAFAADVKPLDSSSVSSLLNAIAAVTPTSYTPTTAVRTPTMPPASMTSNSPPGYTNPLMYSNLPKNAVGTEMPVIPPSSNIAPGMHMSQQTPPPPPQSNLYEKPQIPQDGNYQQTMPQSLGRYPPQENTMPPNYPPHNMVPDQYSHSTTSSNYPPMHMQQQTMPPSHSSMPMDMRHYDTYDNELKRKRMTNAYVEPQARPISPKRRKDGPYGVQYPTYQSPHHDVSPIPMPPSSAQPPPPPHDIYHRSYPSSPIRKPPPTSSVPPPPPPSSPPPPMVSSSGHHAYSGGPPTSGFSRSNTYPPHSYQPPPQQTSPPIVPPRRPDSANFGYSNKPYSKPYYKEETYHDEYDRNQRPYKKYGDDRYQPGNGSTGGPMGSYNRRPDNYSTMSSYSNMDDYSGGDSYYRKPHHYGNGPRRSYNAPNIPETSPKNVPTSDVQPPPPPPPGADLHGDNVNMDYNEKEDHIPEATEPTRHLWVGRFHNMKMDYTTIHSDFEKFGPIDSLNLLRDQKCAFVNFAHVKDAIRAKKELEGTKKYRKIAYQRREKKSSTYSSDYKKNMMPYHKNDYNNYHGGGDNYRHTDQQ